MALSPSMASHSPMSILHRLQELKLWQETQEAKLKTGSQSDSDLYQTIDGLSAFDSSLDCQSDSSNKSMNKSTLPSSFSVSSFLKQNDENSPSQEGPRVKRPFLRKGSGLSRFRLNKPLQPPKVRTKTKPANVDSEHERAITPLRPPDVAIIEPKATWCRVNETEQPKAHDRSSGEKELRIFEALEERANNSSFCSTNSSVVRILQSSTPTKTDLKTQTIVEEKHVRFQERVEIQNHSAIESQSDDSYNMSRPRRDIGDILHRLQEIVASRTTERWGSSSSSSSDVEDNTSSVCSSEFDITLNNTDDQTVNQKCCGCDQELRDKMREYEDKILMVLSDKEKIDELRDQLQGKKRQFESDMARIKADFEQERENFLYELEEEKRLLINEKKSYQFKMEVDERPKTTSKKDREELSNLRRELADAKETLKLKEAKNGMTQARLRNQVKQLEKEAEHLKMEVEKLNRENAKLALAEKSLKIANKRRTSSEAKHNKTNKSNDNKPQVPEKQNEETSSRPHDDSLVELAKESRRPTTSNVDDVERLYAKIFGSTGSTERENREPVQSAGRDKVETVHPDGTKEIKYKNGNTKVISSDGNTVTMKYYNGDVKQSFLLDGTIKYFYADKKIWQTTYPDGTETTEYSDGRIEKRDRNGRYEITLPDNVIQTINPDGTHEIKYPDGSVLNINGDEKILSLPNGQKEIETKEWKRREYPDGTVKTLYPDGKQETRYANGRIRIRGSNGELILDTHDKCN